MKKLLFATTNKFKLKETRDILSVEIDSVDIELDEIQDTEVDNIVIHKVLEAYKIVRKPVMVDDSGLYFNALNGFPGALIKSLMLRIGTNGALKNTDSKNSNVSRILHGFSDKTAYAKTSIAFTESERAGDVIVVSGIINGRISQNAVGNNAFGWDDIFIPDGHVKTFAEMEDIEKNQISMRKQALTKLKKILGL